VAIICGPLSGLPTIWTKLNFPALILAWIAELGYPHCGVDLPRAGKRREPKGSVSEKERHSRLTALIASDSRCGIDPCGAKGGP
jgi:hypothetical protein